MFSAGVNAALAEFFGISHTEETSIPQCSGNIPNEVGNTLPSSSNIPVLIGNIPSVTFVEELPGKQRA